MRSFFRHVPYEGIGHLYAECDVFVMPTLSDYRSVSVLEAMRFGRALIVSRRDGNAGETARHGDNAFLFLFVKSSFQLADFMACLV